jgi:hypothetical protein
LNAGGSMNAPRGAITKRILDLHMKCTRCWGSSAQSFCEKVNGFLKWPGAHEGKENRHLRPFGLNHWPQLMPKELIFVFFSLVHEPCPAETLTIQWSWVSRIRFFGNSIIVSQVNWFCDNGAPYLKTWSAGDSIRLPTDNPRPTGSKQVPHLRSERLKYARPAKITRAGKVSFSSDNSARWRFNSRVWLGGAIRTHQLGRLHLLLLCVLPARPRLPDIAATGIRLV